MQAKRELQKHIQAKEEKLQADMEKARKEEKEKKRRVRCFIGTGACH